MEVMGDNAAYVAVAYGGLIPLVSMVIYMDC